MKNNIKIFSDASLTAKMIEILLSHNSFKSELIQKFPDDIQKDEIYILDDTEFNHRLITAFLQKNTFSNKCLVLIDCNRKSTIRSYVNYKIGSIVSYKAAYEELIKAIDCLLNGEIYFSENIKENLLKELFISDSGQLTKKEKEIINLFGHGHSASEIAKILESSPMTVNVHRLNIKKKLGFSKNNQFIKYCIDLLNKT